MGAHFENEYITFWFEADILCSRPKIKKMEDIEQAKQIVRLRVLAADNIARPLLIDAGNVITMSREVREFYASPEGYKSIKAIAVVFNTPVQKVIGTLFIHYYKPLAPTKLFTNRGDAKAWLKQFV